MRVSSLATGVRLLRSATSFLPIWPAQRRMCANGVLNSSAQKQESVGCRRISLRKPSKCRQWDSPATTRQVSVCSRAYDSGYDSGGDDNEPDEQFGEFVYLSDLEDKDEEQELARPQVHCFWDLDNKTVASRNDIKPTVANIRKALEQFGELASLQAFGNTSCFSYVPPKERADRQARKDSRDEVADDAIRCEVCGHKFHSLAKLEKHFYLHAREYQKKRNRQKFPKKKISRRLQEEYFENADKMSKYHGTRLKFSSPKTGFALQRGLRNENVVVVKTSNAKQAADKELKKAVRRFLGTVGQDRSVHYVACIISDDRGFTEDFQKTAKNPNVTGRVAVCTSAGRFGADADHYLDWDLVKNGLAKNGLA